METFDLEKFNVEEMSAIEMKRKSGGFSPVINMFLALSTITIIIFVCVFTGKRRTKQ